MLKIQDMIQKGCKYWFIYKDKPMECILLEEQEHCFKIQTEMGIVYSRKVFEDREQVEAYIEDLMPNSNLRELSLHRIIEGRMDIVDILISLLCLEEKRIGNLRRCIVEIQKRGYAEDQDIRLMQGCGIPIYKKYIEDKELEVSKYATESFTMDFELCKKYITEFVVELSEYVIKGLEFNKNTRL